METNVEKSEKSEKTEKTEKTENKVKVSAKTVIKVVAAVIGCAAIIFGSFEIAKWLDTRSRVPSNKIVDGEQVNEVKITFNDYGSITVKPVKAVTKLRTSASVYDIPDDSGTEPNDEHFLSFEMFDESFYLEAITTDGNRKIERYISNEPIGIGTYSLSDVSNVINSVDGEGLEEDIVDDINDTSETAETETAETNETEAAENEENTDDVDSLLTRYRVKPLYKEGFALGIYQSLNSDKFEIVDYRDQLKYVKEYNNDKYIDFEGIGRVNMNSIPSFSDDIALAYHDTNNILMVFNPTLGESNLFITSMNNSALGNVYENLVETDYNNVYKDVGWDDDSSFGYRGFAVVTESGVYYFRIGENLKDPDKVFEEVLEALNIHKDDPKI